jgi:2-haloacid dehalogenase
MIVATPQTVTSGPSRSAQRATTKSSRFKAVAFDYFVLFDPDSILPELERVYPGRGRELMTLWRNRQFEYAWLRSMTGQYTDFFTVSEDALNYAAHAMQLEMTSEQRSDLLNAYLRLTPWPDTMNALRRLRSHGVRIIALANFSPSMLQANAQHAGLSGLIDELVSTDRNHTFKPDPRAYRLGVDRLHVPKQEIVFAAFGGWDAAGAKAFGYPTFWVNRFNQPVEELGIRPDWTSTNLEALLDLVLGQ